MRIPVAAITLVLALVVSATAAERPLNTIDQIVVDKTTRDEALNNYVLQTRDAIQRAWRTPVNVVTSSALKGRISINYTLSRSGALGEVRLVHGSGNNQMDRSLMQAIREAAPFPPFPQGINARRVLIRARFVVADTPTEAPTTVQAEVRNHTTPQEAVSESSDKKYRWGTPAETSSRDKLVTSASDELPPRPPFKKFRWGLEP